MLGEVLEVRRISSIGQLIPNLFVSIRQGMPNIARKAWFKRWRMALSFVYIIN